MFNLKKAGRLMAETSPQNRLFTPRWLSSLTLGGFTVLITLLMIEMVVRAVPLYPDNFEIYDPDRGWVLAPNKSGVFLNVACLGEFRAPVTINSQGLRDVEHSYDKPPDTYRILIVGDSTVAAFEVPLEQTFHRLLEARLNQGGARRYEVIGGGNRGYGTDLEVLYYEQEGRRYQPDIVILLIQPGNDIQDNQLDLRTRSEPYFPYFTLDENGELIFHHPSEFAPPGEPGPAYINPIHNTLLNVSRLYRLLYDRKYLVERVQQTYAEGRDPEADRRAWAEAWDVTRALIARLRDDVEQDGAQFAIVVAPGRFGVPEEGEAIHVRLNAMLDELNIPYLNLLSIYGAQETPERPLHFACDTHWNAAGHALAAEAMAVYVPTLIEGTL